VLEIVVTPNKERITFVDGKTMTVYQTVIKREGKVCRLRECKDFANVRKADIIVLRRAQPFIGLQLNLTPQIKKGIVKVLNRYHRKQKLSFSCYQFVNLVYGVNRRYGTKWWKMFWKVETSHKRRKVGDVVFLVDHAENMFYHSAIYIGFGLYLSVYGAGGDLEVATLKDMMRGFDAKDVDHVIPC